jgi:hypothetical protein
MLARLVPGHAEALRRSLRLQWGLHTAFWAGLGLLLTNSNAWALWLLGVGSSLGLLVWLVLHPLLWVAVGLGLPLGLVVLRKQVGPLAPHLEALHNALANPGPAAFSVAVVAAIWVALMGLAIRHGDGRHRRHAELRDRVRQASLAMRQGGGMPVRHQVGFWGWMHRLISSLWQHLLRRGLRPGVAPASIGRLNLLLAGPSHWARQAGWAIFLTLLIGLPLGALLAWLPSPKSGQAPLEAMRFGLCMGVFSLGMNPLLQLGASMLSRQREQGLLALAPGVPQGAVLRKAWTAYQVRQYLIGWSLCTAFTMGLMAAYGGPSALRFVAGFAGACLPMVSMAWRDWGRLKSGGALGGSLQASNLAALGAATLAAGLAEYLAVPVLVSLGLGAVLALALCVAAGFGRGRRSAPFPVGRIS